MSGFRKLNSKDLQQLLISLRKGFPYTKEFFQLGKDIINERLKANLFVDSWPRFSTIISQEFSPRLSKHSEVRLYTTQMESIWPVIDYAKLLDDIGDYKLVHYRTEKEDGEPLTSFLLNGFKSHPKTKLKKFEVVYDYSCYSVSNDIPNDKISLPKGFSVRKLLPDTAEFIANHWHLSEEPLYDLPVKNYVKYFEDILTAFEVLGIYENGNENYPVAWSGMTFGGERAFAYTMEKYRNCGFFFILRNILTEKHLAQGDSMIINNNFPGLKDAFGYEFIGKSRIICIH